MRCGSLLQVHGTIDRYHELHHFCGRSASNFYRRLIDFHVSDGNFDTRHPFEIDLKLLSSVAALWLIIIFRFTIAIAVHFFWHGNACNILLFRAQLACTFNESRRHGLWIGMVSIPTQQSNRHIAHDTASSSTIFHHRIRLDEMRFGKFHRSEWEIFNLEEWRFESGDKMKLEMPPIPSFTLKCIYQINFNDSDSFNSQVLRAIFSAVMVMRRINQ